jgi:hypothetical protein
MLRNEHIKLYIRNVIKSTEQRDSKLVSPPISITSEGWVFGKMHMSDIAMSMKGYNWLHIFLQFFHYFTG